MCKSEVDSVQDERDKNLEFVSGLKKDQEDEELLVEISSLLRLFIVKGSEDRETNFSAPQFKSR